MSDETGGGAHRARPRLRPWHVMGIAALGLLALLAVIAWVLGPRKGFATPEKAVEHYVKRVASNDFGGALQAGVVGDHAVRHDFAAMARFVQMLNPAARRLPSHYKMYADMNRAWASAEFAQGTKLFMLGFLAPDGASGKMTRPVGDAEIDAFVDAIDPVRLRTLKLVRVDLPRQSVTKSERALALGKQHAAPEGADDATERIALYEWEGRTFWSGFQLLRFGDTWQIDGFLSSFAGEPGHGVVQPTTPEAYEALLQ